MYMYFVINSFSTAYAKEKDIHLSEEIIDTQELSEAGNTNYGDLEEPDDMHNLEKQEGLQIRTLSRTPKVLKT